MNDRKKLAAKVKKLSLYFSVFSLGVLIGVYVFFPTNLIKSILNKSGSIYVENVKLLFPPGIALQTVDLKIDTRSINADEVIISPTLFSVFTLPVGKIPLKLKVKTYISDISLDITLLKRAGKFFPYRVKSKGVIGLEDISQLVDVITKGSVKYNFEIVGFDKGVTAVSGKINLYTEKITVEIVNSLKLGSFFEGELRFGKTQAEMLINQGFLKIVNFRSEGGDVEGTISGMVKIEKSLQNSQLDLIVELKTKIINIPKQKFRIQGTISSPMIS